MSLPLWDLEDRAGIVRNICADQPESDDWRGSSGNVQIAGGLLQRLGGCSSPTGGCASQPQGQRLRENAFYACSRAV